MSWSDVPLIIQEQIIAADRVKAVGRSVMTNRLWHCIRRVRDGVVWIALIAGLFAVG